MSELTQVVEACKNKTPIPKKIVLKYKLTEIFIFSYSPHSDYCTAIREIKQ
jgi:hypothetical protein